MISHTAVFAVAVVLFLMLLLTAAAVSFRSAKRRSGNHIGDLLQRLEAVDRDKLAQVALDFDRSDKERIDTEPLEGWQVWELVGGLDGMEALLANCEVLIDLACHVQQHYPEALPIAEQLRLNAREIQWHLERLRGAATRGNLQSVFPDYAQRATAIYYGMTRSVLALYEATQTPGISELQAAI